MSYYQRKLSTNVGRDSHVRNFQGNAFKQQSSKTSQFLSGEIAFAEPEPIFKQNMVTVNLTRGGKITSVAYPGAFIDPITGNLHGTYEGPIPGQMVTVGFENGNNSDPVVINRYPYQGYGNTLTESAYINPLTRSFFDSTDVMIGHFSGSYLSFNTGILSGQIPGSVSLNAATDFNLSANINLKFNSTLGANFELNTLVSINSTTQSMKTLVDNLLDILDTFGTTGSPVAHTTDAVTKAKIAIEKTKWALLLS